MILLYDKEKLEIEILLVVRCSLQTFLHELRKLKKVPTNTCQQTIFNKYLTSSSFFCMIYFTKLAFAISCNFCSKIQDEK